MTDLDSLTRRSLLRTTALATGALALGPSFWKRAVASAATVGDETISSTELSDEVEAWASNPAALQAIGVPEAGQQGRRSFALVSFVLSHRIVT